MQSTAVIHARVHHYGVQLWVPEVAGQIDPGSGPQDLMTSVFADPAWDRPGSTRSRRRLWWQDYSGVAYLGQPVDDPVEHRVGVGPWEPRPQAAQRREAVQRDRDGRRVASRVVAC